MQDNGWERHQEHVLSELRRLSDKVDALDSQMTDFHTNHLSDLKVELAEMRATMKLFCALAASAGPIAVAALEVFFK